MFLSLSPSRVKDQGLAFESRMGIMLSYCFDVKFLDICKRGRIIRCWCVSVTVQGFWLLTNCTYLYMESSSFEAAVGSAIRLGMRNAFINP